MEQQPHLLATVTDGECKGEIVLPYAKLRFGWMCARAGQLPPKYIDFEHLYFWKHILNLSDHNTTLPVKSNVTNQ